MDNKSVAVKRTALKANVGARGACRGKRRSGLRTGGLDSGRSLQSAKVRGGGVQRTHRQRSHTPREGTMPTLSSLPESPLQRRQKQLRELYKKEVGEEAPIFTSMPPYTGADHTQVELVEIADVWDIAGNEINMHLVRDIFLGTNCNVNESSASGGPKSVPLSEAQMSACVLSIAYRKEVLWNGKSSIRAQKFSLQEGNHRLAAAIMAGLPGM